MPILLNRFHSSGRCALGSHCPNSLRKENTRSLARAFSSSRRAPPIHASKPNSSIASSKVVACAALRESLALRNATVPLAMESSTLRTISVRSEEHTSELQSLMRISYAVFCLKKKKQTIDTNIKNGSQLSTSRNLRTHQKKL